MTTDVIARVEHVRPMCRRVGHGNCQSPVRTACYAARRLFCVRIKIHNGLQGHNDSMTGVRRYQHTCNKPARIILARVTVIHSAALSAHCTIIILTNERIKLLTRKAENEVNKVYQAQLSISKRGCPAFRRASSFFKVITHTAFNE